MKKNELQNKLSILVHEQLKEENDSTRQLVNALLLLVDAHRDNQSPSQIVRKKLDAEIQKMIDAGVLEELEDELDS